MKMNGIIRIEIFWASIYGHLRVSNFAAIIPLATDKMEQIQTGTIISKGAAEPAAVRRVSRVVGISVIDAVLMTTNMHMSSVATPGVRLRASSLFMAARPKGVAAFERPKRFAVILITMALFASEPSGREGNRILVMGESKRSIFLVIPACSATSNSPVHRHIMPMRDITIWVALSAPENTLAVTASVVPAKKEYM